MTSELDRAPLLPLGDYAAPDAPTHDLLQRLRDRIAPLLSRDRTPTVHDDRLERAEQATLDDYVAIPDCSIVVDELDRAVDEWIADESSNSRVLLLVMPPCETRGLVRRIAERRGFGIVDEPGREAILDAGGASIPPLSAAASGHEVVAIARLERWFLRHRHGLALLRTVLAEIASSERRCLVAINSWGWEFIVKAALADLLLPAPRTSRPSDANRLREWLVELETDAGTAPITVRAIEDGKDVLALDEDGKLRHPFLAELASRSHGVPWVAWQLWRRGLRTLPAKEDGQQNNGADDPRTDSARLQDKPAARELARDDCHTMWVTHGPPMSLPTGHEQQALLVLQALLIHGFLDSAELDAVLPIVGESGIVRALERCGFVERVDEAFRCRPAAYPSIRAALHDAGYPVPPV